MTRKPFELFKESDMYGHRMDDCKNGCPDNCPGKLSANLVNLAIEHDKAHSIALLAKSYEEIANLKSKLNQNNK